jgi:peptidoglycan hydrolase-like protein with peptidoglycan-binding domain
MTLTKKILTTTVSLIAIAGMLLVSTPAHARFFDIFKNNTLQEAAAIKAASTITPEKTSFEKEYEKSEELFTKSVRYGQSNDEVKKLQAVLKAQGVLEGEIDGKYGKQTREAVKKVQRANGINGNGYAVGAGTREALKESLSKVKEVRASNPARSSNPWIVAPQEPATLSPASSSASCDPSDEPWIEVVSPNGGEYYSVGDEMLVQWDSCNLEEDVYIHTSKITGYGESYFNYGPTEDDGSELVEIPTGFSGFYKVTIFNESSFFNESAGVNDISDDVFEIGEQGGQSCLTASQHASILNLLASFGVSQGVTDDVDDALNGGNGPFTGAGSAMSQSQIGAVVSLLNAFDCDQETVDLVESILDGSYLPEEQALGQISFWYGKVNVHRENGGVWETDPDGVAGAGTYAQWGDEGWIDRKVEYCQRFWPNTTFVSEAGLMQITGWYGRNNVGGPLTSTKMAYNCLGGEEQLPISLEWMTVANTTITQNVNHLVGRLRFYNNTNQEIQFTDTYGNSIPVTFAPYVNDPNYNQAASITFKDSAGNTLGTGEYYGIIGNQDIVNYFDSNDFVIDPYAYEDMFIYIDSSVLEDPNDSIQLIMNPALSSLFGFGIYQGQAHNTSFSEDIMLDMPSQQSQLHIVPS